MKKFKITIKLIQILNEKFNNLFHFDFRNNLIKILKNIKILLLI